ncbi:nucleotidyltransferase domain-containing protein [bacterium]|nr:nucleotidyltransferase domain-containing protein [bacterium]
MPKASSHFVRVEYLHLIDILPKLRESLKGLKQNPNVVSVKLFGSLVKGNYSPGSDADILILLQKDSRRIIDRIPEYLAYFSHVPIAVEVFPYTEEEYAKMNVSDNQFISSISEWAIEL